MTLRVFSIYDVQVGAFAPPFSASTIGQASRMFEDAVNQDGPMRKHPGDYRLFHLGEMDDQDGSLKSLPSPQLVRDAADCLERVS